MRSSTAVRRAHLVARDEEKKEDDREASSSPNTSLRRRKKSRLRTMGTAAASKETLLFILFLAMMGAFCLGVFLAQTGFVSAIVDMTSRFRGYRTQRDLRVKLSTQGKKQIRHPHRALDEKTSVINSPDYGGLKNFLRPVSTREIVFGREDELSFQAFKPKDDETLTNASDAFYYAFDDDEKRNPKHQYEDKSEPLRNHCRRVSWHRDIFPNCNNFHELDVVGLAFDDGMSYIGGGSYRNVFRLEERASDPDLILKVAEIELDYDVRDYEFMRVEGAVFSALPKHPLLVETFGFCALSLFSEPMMSGDVEKRAVPKYRRRHCHEMPNFDEDFKPMNQLDGTKKLEWALQMAEAVALLHNHERGVIVHDDIQLPQFMVTDDGHLKMGDFNRAEIMLYDDEHGKYCRYRNGVGRGDWRAPEEYRDTLLNEKIDIWSLGTNFFSLLTGLAPFYEECSDKKAANRIKKGEIPNIHPYWKENSFAESILVDIIKDCWTVDPDRRPSIGDLVTRLRDGFMRNRENEGRAISQS